MVNGPRINLQTIVPPVLLVLTMAGAFWALADPRGDIRDIKKDYLSLREHEEFVRRFNADLGRIELAQRETARMVEVEARMKIMSDRINTLQGQVDLLIGRSLIQPPPK